MPTDHYCSAIVMTGFGFKSTLFFSLQMVFAHQIGMALVVGLKGLLGKYPFPVQSISLTSTIKVSLALDTVSS